MVRRSMNPSQVSPLNPTTHGWCDMYFPALGPHIHQWFSMVYISTSLTSLCRSSSESVA